MKRGIEEALQVLLKSYPKSNQEKLKNQGRGPVQVQARVPQALLENDLALDLKKHLNLLSITIT